MKKILVGILFLASTGIYASDADRGGVYHCHCEDVTCIYSDFTIDYNRGTQFFKAVGAKWEVSGYFTRAESKTTDEVFLFAPSAGTFGKLTLVFSASGEVRAPEIQASCKLGR